MSVIDELVEANARYADGFDKGGLAMPPGRHVAVVTCMDARLVPARMLGLKEGMRTSSATPADGSRTRCARSSSLSACWARTR